MLHRISHDDLIKLSVPFKQYGYGAAMDEHRVVQVMPSELRRDDKSDSSGHPSIGLNSRRLDDPRPHPFGFVIRVLRVGPPGFLEGHQAVVEPAIDALCFVALLGSSS